MFICFCRYGVWLVFKDGLAVYGGGLLKDSRTRYGHGDGGFAVMFGQGFEDGAGNGQPAVVKSGQDAGDFDVNAVGLGFEDVIGMACCANFA